jgi:Fe-S oxidoreductase
MRVGLFVTCPVDLMRPRIGFAAVKLLEAAGCEAVVLGDLGCMLNIEGKLRRMGDKIPRVPHFAEIVSGER